MGSNGRTTRGADVAALVVTTTGRCPVKARGIKGWPPRIQLRRPIEPGMDESIDRSTGNLLCSQFLQRTASNQPSESARQNLGNDVRGRCPYSPPPPRPAMQNNRTGDSFATVSCRIRLPPHRFWVKLHGALRGDRSSTMTPSFDWEKWSEFASYQSLGESSPTTRLRRSSERASD